MSVPLERQRSIEAVIEARIEMKRRKQIAAEAIHRSSYQCESRRPLVCLLFVMPLILAYEVGTILLGGFAQRSGVDQWLSQLLVTIGVGKLILLPIVTTTILIVWHHRIDDHWRLRFQVFGLMILESVGLGLMLFWAANAFHLLAHAASPAIVDTSLRLAPHEWWAATTAMIGSGIYEELFFRLIVLLPLIHWLSKQIDPRQAKVIGILAVSFLFASLHYDFINPSGAVFEWSSFSFRFFASVAFSVLFLYRGFGLAVGAHAAYDVLTQL